MFYHKVAVEHMLRFGIACWEDIKWQLKATGRLPHKTLAEPLLDIERAWGADRHLAKSSIHSNTRMFGAHGVNVRCCSQQCVDTSVRFRGRERHM